MRTRTFIPILMLGLAACSPAPEASRPVEATAAASTAASGALSVSVADFMIEPSDLEVAGPAVTIAVTNDGPTPHNLTVRTADGDVVLATTDLSIGESETVSAELAPGEYVIFCSLAGHESLGMSGSLIVSGS